MESTRTQKLGAGIITVSVIHFVGAVLGVLGSIGILLTKDLVQSQLDQMGQTVEISTTQIIIGLILTIILVVGVILILLKKSIGVYTYFTCTVVNIIFNIIMNGFKLSILLSFILPVLMVIFIKNKKELFGFGILEESVSM